MYDGTLIQSETQADTWYASKSGWGFVVSGQPGSNVADPQSRGHNMGNAAVFGSWQQRKSRNITIRDCIFCNAPGAGLGIERADYVWLEYNLYTNNCRGSGFGQSGRTSFYAEAADNATSEFYTDKRYRIVERGSVSHTNWMLTPSSHDGDTVNSKDGNGWQVADIYYRADNRSVPGAASGAYAYPHPSLIESCLAFNNGGSGMQTVNSNLVTMRNNTCYANQVKYYRAEMWFGWGNDEGAYNNILVPTRSGSPGFNQVSTNRTVGGHNIRFGDTGSFALPNDLQANPLFVNPSINTTVANFGLQAGSPAIDRINTGVVAPLDLFRNTKSTPDAGAIWRV